MLDFLASRQVEAKQFAYTLDGIVETGFFAKRVSSPFSEVSMQRPGLFTPIASLGEFRGQLRAVPGMPLICLTTALASSFMCVSSTCSALLSFALLDFERAGNLVEPIFHSFVTALYFLGSALIDTLFAALALVTRSLSTVVNGVVEAGISVVACCTSDSKRERDDLPREENDSYSEGYSSSRGMGR